MSTPPSHSRDSHPHDPLLQRYEEANAHDEARPNAALREAVLAHATTQITASGPPEKVQRPAANDRQWTWRALGSIAVLGLVGLLVMQFERGTPDEQHIALGNSSQQAERSVAAAGAKASALADASTGDPSAEVAPEKASEAASTRPPEPPPVAPPVIADAEGPATVATPASPAKATKIEALDAFEPAERTAAMAPAAGAEPPLATEPMARAAPVSSADAAPSMAQAETPAPMASARSVAPPRSTLNESQQRAKRDIASENQANNPAGLASGSAQAALQPLHAAAIKGDLPAAQSLLAQGVDINARDSLGRTALMLAAMGRQKNLVVELMDGGADATLRDLVGLSAADHALRAGHADWLPLLQPRR